MSALFVALVIYVVAAASGAVSRKPLLLLAVLVFVGSACAAVLAIAFRSRFGRQEQTHEAWHEETHEAWRGLVVKAVLAVIMGTALWVWILLH